MTITGTSYDHLTLEELNDGLATGEIRLADLPHELISAWAAWEPELADLTTYALSYTEQRVEFLHQYCYQGEPVLLVAVAHIWDSLAEPREARCIQIGLASGAGGKGKMALVLMLQKMLAECNAIGAVLPDKGGFAGPDEWHQAVMAHFAGGEEQERALCRSYADILDGQL